MRSNDVRRVFDEGRTLHGDRVVLFLAPGSGASTAVAGRRVGGAVERNRAKRVIRAAWHEIASRNDDEDVILVARAGIGGAKTQDLVAEMTEMLRRDRR